MSPIAAISKSDLDRRRSQLRKQRRWKLLRGMWRTVAVAGIAAGVVWVARLPIWLLQSSEQVIIEGEEVLTEDTIRSLLPIAYPYPLVKLRPQAIAAHLEAQAPIADAVVIRHIFPPRLVVQIQERHPVALLVSANTPDVIPRPQTLPTGASTPPSASMPIELLDEKGFRMSFENYVTLNKFAKLPDLRVIGMQEQYRSQWETMYQSILHSPVKISEVNWQEPTNVILETELGSVHIGAYTDAFPQQLQILDQMRRVPEQLDSRQIDYIDLTQPDAPLLELGTNSGSGAWLFKVEGEP
ncbi:MAG: FtsQ-type POTRA domain-containing protein [Synechococcales cyanobacterium T60_A2020_003]|nr:FtsQ-type POTRA domain-containing protein [Synechococcales cyanobacterium T60_A2020_003]